MCAPGSKQWRQRTQLCHLLTKLALIAVPFAIEKFSSMQYGVLVSFADSQAREQAQYYQSMGALASITNHSATSTYMQSKW